MLVHAAMDAAIPRVELVASERGEGAPEGDASGQRPGLDRLTREFPTLAFAWRHPGAPGGGADAITVDDREWRGDVDLAALDRAFDGTSEDPDVAARPSLRVRGAAASLVLTALQVLTRLQRHVWRTNASSGAPQFHAALARHRALHDRSKPRVRADYHHACDTWQWMLRLEPRAGLAVQLAALFHDIERLETEADARVEHHAPDYQAFKDAHAQAGADIAARTLGDLFGAAVVERVGSLITGHERRSADPDAALLGDADALSFFSLNSDGYLDYFGVEQTERKVRWTLARMSARARERMRDVRLRADVAALVDRAGRTAGVPS
jgi:hypothetical protein